MLNDKLMDRVNRLIQTQLAERGKQLQKDISLIKEKATGGNLYSSSTVVKIQTRCCQELEIRAMLVWQSLFRVIQIHGIQSTGNLATDLKAIERDYISRNAEEIYATMKNEGQLCHGLKIQFDEDKVKSQVLEKICIEIDLYVDSLARNVSAPKTGESNEDVYNFYGPVGCVQTGTGAAANVIQNLGTEEKKNLEKAIDEVRKGLENIRDIAESEREEIVELIQDTKAELAKAKPNNTKIRTILTQVGMTIRTIGSLHSVYQLLKIALLPLGIMLP